VNPAAIRDQRFLLVRRGYDPEAVLSFLDEVADALEAARAGQGDTTSGAVEVADADRLVDEARTRAATHRLRAQRDIEALHRTARARRARLVAEIEELAVARDQLSEDLDRAVDVVDRVVQWVRRTDPAADATVGGTVLAEPGSDPPAEPAEVAPTPPPDLDDLPDVPDVGVDLDDPNDPDVPDAADGAAAEEDATLAATEDESPAEVPVDPVAESADEASVDGADPDDEDDWGHGGDGGDGDVAAVAADPTPDAAPDPDDQVAGPVPVPGGEAVRDALRSVQDEVLGNLRDRPRGSVDDWVPSTTVLLALDDAATDACGRAFLAGWDEADPEFDDDVDAGSGQSAPAARDALEEVRGAGSLPGLGIADDLRVAVRASLQRGVDGGDAPPQLVERVAEVHRDVRQTVVVEALDLATSAARHHGLVARWRHDDVTAIAWVLGEERRCPGRRCRANANDGVVAPGETFAFGEVVPPAHPGCTCTVRRVEPDEVASGG